MFPPGREIGDCSIDQQVLSCSHRVLPHTDAGDRRLMDSSSDDAIAALTEDRAFFR